jgi:asparagine synthetase B (glutamine-hydrolysing)
MDPAGGVQPLTSEDGRLAVVANGEIFSNHEEVARNVGCWATRPEPIS